jgi:glycosyltransferase involved in cell wall biosynthesis
VKITFPLEGFNVSGGLRIITNVANGLARKGHSVRIVVPDYASSSHFRLDEGIELVVVSTQKFGRFKKIYYRLIICMHATHKSNVAFATGYKTPYYLLASKLACNWRVKLVYLIQGYEPLSHVLHSTNFNLLSKKILYAVAKLSYRLPLVKIAVSSWLKTQIDMESVAVVSNGVDLTVFCPAPFDSHKSDAFVVGIIGSRSPGKGYAVFLQAMEHIVTKNESGIRVLLASQSAIELPLGIQTELVRPVNDGEMVQFYRRCDVFVFASFVEGFGLPPLEAMACGVPVITTDCGGIGDFANDENSIVIPAGNAAALAVAILRIRNDKQLRNSLREHGLESSKKFSLSSMIDKYCQLIESI